MSEISRIQINGTSYDISDAAARQSIISILTSNKTIVKTTEEWDSDISYIPNKGYICVYSDYSIKEDKPIPAIKIGDGTSYLIDLPFVTNGAIEETLNNHINDMTRHITSAERESWDNKISCYIDVDNPEQVIFSL